MFVYFEGRTDIKSNLSNILDIRDGGGMANPEAPILDVLSHRWIDADGRWIADIHAYHLELYREEKKAYDDLFGHFSAEADPKGRIEPELKNRRIESECEMISGELVEFYVENNKMHLLIQYDDANEESVVLYPSDSEDEE